MRKNVYVIFAAFLILVLLIFLLATYNYGSSVANSEKFDSPLVGNYPGRLPEKSIAASATPNTNSAAGVVDGSPFGPSDPTGNELYNSVVESTGTQDGSAGSASPSCFPQDRLTADQLLPKDASNTRWAQMNPAGQGDVSNGNYLQAGYFTGIDTKGQSLRNANRQLRSEPANPQVVVSPWMQSSIEYDNNRKTFEIGA